MSTGLHQKLMSAGKLSGCHQMQERSFSIHDRKFPLCSRCTGVLIGNLTAYALFLIYAPSMQVCLAGCAIMFIDWLVQRLGVWQSTNPRRLVTGIIGGYSLTTLICMFIKYAIHLVI